MCMRGDTIRDYQLLLPVVNEICDAKIWSWRLGLPTANRDFARQLAYENKHLIMLHVLFMD